MQDKTDVVVFIVETALCAGLDVIRITQGVFLDNEEALKVVHALRMVDKTKKKQAARKLVGVSHVEHTMIERPLETYKTWKEGR